MSLSVEDRSGARAASTDTLALTVERPVTGRRQSNRVAVRRAIRAGGCPYVTNGIRTVTDGGRVGQYGGGMTQMAGEWGP
jgi:hypothetical protein